jgi:hypothetical protein
MELEEFRSLVPCSAIILYLKQKPPRFRRQTITVSMGKGNNEKGRNK